MAYMIDTVAAIINRMVAMRAHTEILVHMPSDQV